MSGASICTCNNCSGQLEFDASNAGTTIQCPHCKLDTVLFVPNVAAVPARRGFAWPAREQSPPLGRWVLIGGALIAAVVIGSILTSRDSPTRRAAPAAEPQPATTNAPQASASTKTNEPAPQPPIEGLFGLKLGEPVPTNCVFEWGIRIPNVPLYAWITPPEPNPAFGMYTVDLDADRRLVASIHANTKPYDDESEFERVREAIIAKLNQRYGPAPLFGDETLSGYWWRRGQRDISLWWENGKKRLFISCTDTNLNYSVERQKPPVDTQGL
jgi:hypothetical protein